MDRRNCLQALGAGALSAAALPSAEARRVTVDSLEVFRVRVNRLGNWVLFRLRTNDGLTGIGDASHGSRDDNQIAELGRQFAAWMKGKSIFDVEPLRAMAHPEVAKTGRPAAVAFGGIEQCLWDLQGKALGVPLYQLFGGLLRRKMRNYANINRSTEDRTPAGFAKMAARAVAAGFDAIKLASWDGMPRQGGAAAIARHTQLGIDCAAAVRKAIGDKNDLLLDAHNNFTLEGGLELARRLEPLNLYWLEEVIRSFESLAVINKAAKMATAGGESLFGVETFYKYISAGAVDIVMPDIKYCGGLLELKKIAAMAEGAGLTTAPHGPASPVGNMAAAHVCATMPNFDILEFSFGEIPWRAELVEPPEQLERGMLSVTERPGIGYELNEKTIRAHSP